MFVNDATRQVAQEYLHGTVLRVLHVSYGPYG